MHDLGSVEDCIFPMGSMLYGMHDMESVVIKVVSCFKGPLFLISESQVVEHALHSTWDLLIDFRWEQLCCVCLI